MILIWICPRLRIGMMLLVRKMLSLLFIFLDSFNVSVFLCIYRIFFCIE